MVYCGSTYALSDSYLNTQTLAEEQQKRKKNERTKRIVTTITTTTTTGKNISHLHNNLLTITREKK